MKLTVRRDYFGNTCTIGKLLIDGVPSGIVTLEDEVREIAGMPVAQWKVPGNTAIPKGSYRVVVDYSPHFGHGLPHILDVPGFEGVRIHSGNSSVDTEGCILLGKTWDGGDWIGKSREAFDEIFAKILAADSVTIDVL